MAMVNHFNRTAQILQMQRHKLGNVSIVLNNQDGARHTLLFLSHSVVIRARILEKYHESITVVGVLWLGAGIGDRAVQGMLITQSRAPVGQVLPRTPAQAEPAIPGLKGWPLTVASSSTGAGLRRAAMVKQVASAIVMSCAIRSGGSSLSSDSSVRIASHVVLASPARTEPVREYRAMTVIRTFFGSIWSARATCTICVASQKPTATVK